MGFLPYHHLGHFCFADGRDHVRMIIAFKSPTPVGVRDDTLGRGRTVTGSPLDEQHTLEWP